MNLVPFTYCLPPLLGYLLFVGISGRLDPVSWPRRRVERPSWALGLWVGIAVSSVLVLELRSADVTSIEGAAALLAPSARALSALLPVGLLGWLAYRDAIARTLEAEALRGREESLENARIDHFPIADDEAVLGDAPVPTDARADTGLGAVTAAIIERAAPIPLDAVPREAHEIALGAADDEIGLACLALSHEEAVRGETEKHLRITRRALARLEAESRHHESDKADALIALEGELAGRIRESATARARATREAARRIEAERSIVSLKQNVLCARRELRRSLASRAKALSAATRSIALTRQAVKARARLEVRLREAEKTLADREITLSSVIRALEQEKGRTREEVGALARQLVLHEKRSRARRSREEVSRSVEGKLTTRLARKVARARPLVSGG